MKIVTIIGARPQFIKAAAVSRAISEHNRLSLNGSHLAEIIIHTGQHYDENMSDIFFKELEIPKPNYCLDVHGLSHGAMTGQMMEKIEKILSDERPDMVLVYGDTNTTLAGALTAVKLHIPIAHVEAGLRSYNRVMPEEVNRVITDHLSTILFCPTETAVNNLKKEGLANVLDPVNPVSRTAPVDPNSPIVFNVGDVMHDSVLFYSDKAENRLNILEKLEVEPQKYGLVTIHRAENTDNSTRLSHILEALDTVSKELLIIWPMHPRNKRSINQLNFSFDDDRFKVIDPVGYLDFLLLEKNAKMIFTDSGGIQKEAYFLQIPCITLRDETEWVETIESGFNVLTGSNRAKIIDAYYHGMEQEPFIKKGLFGDGYASDKIVDVFGKYFIG